MRRGYCTLVLSFHRIHELFDILVEFPDSEPALLDLRECLKVVDLRSFLINCLQTVYVLVFFCHYKYV